MRFAQEILSIKSTFINTPPQKKDTVDSRFRAPEK